MWVILCSCGLDPTPVWRNGIDGLAKSLRDMDHHNPSYSERYPELLEIDRWLAVGQGVPPEGNRFLRNLFVSGRWLRIFWYAQEELIEIRDNWLVPEAGDPGWVDPEDPARAGWALRDVDSPVYAYRPLYEMIKRVGDTGLTPGLVRRLDQRPPNGRLVFHSSRWWPSSRLRGGSLRAAYIGPGRAVPKWADAAFRLGESEDRSGLVSYASKMGPSQIALGPGCDEKTSHMLRNAGFRVYPVHEARQMLLSFF